MYADQIQDLATRLLRADSPDFVPILTSAFSNSRLEIEAITRTAIGFEGERDKAHQAIRGVIEANARLAEIDPESNTTFYEASPSKNVECAARWIALNDALAAAKRLTA